MADFQPRSRCLLVICSGCRPLTRVPLEYKSRKTWRFGTFPGGANIFPRNLTPDVSGKPEGGHTLEEFINIMRTGHDYDAAHPPCPQTGAEGCIQAIPGAPLNGNVLQIMPWPTFSQMSDNDLKAIYEYLSAVPCISHQNAPVPLRPGTPPLPSILYQSCPAPEGD